MKTKIFLGLFAFMLISFTGCEKNNDIMPEPIILQLNEKGQKLVNSASDFGIDLFVKTVQSETEKENLMISPYSVSTALAMTYNGAGGNTKTAMGNTLNYDGLNDDEININYKQLTDALLDLDPKVQLSVANSIWYDNNFSVQQDFIDINKNFYNAEVSKLDFGNSASKDVINNWVAENTSNKIKQIIDKIDPDEVMFLINAIYFKGQWKYKFDKSKNFNSTFFLADGTTRQVEMMGEELKLSKFGNELLSMIEMPFGRGNWAMDFILPKEGKKLDDVVNELSATSLSSWLSSLSSPSSIQVSLPPFKFEYSKKLNELLSQMGMDIAFQPALADFSGINPNEQLYISKVQHKTFIEVNEEGAEAAAATSVGMTFTSIGDGIIFNRPFMFLIRETTTGTILFIGKVENPVR